ncbi:hypothetical protein [Thermoflavimicrobium dichotomicum]|uniref:Uncharacterized protein n=1 Tax=Thermoflavimicrobium dichotomicum TaxID=46223 RepID=A0A1I3M0G0_9BACL|nr:hypothetical protein [Thermoflavimicrobium dichotomicum]SFI90448.1 hypothetical protein SAMN05421852_102397 [Thermoflavimicrobium dichotomicum]
MDQQKKQLVAMILAILKDLYDKICKLEAVFDSNSIHILSRNIDPVQQLLQILEIPEDSHDHFYNLMQLYLEEEMTLPEILLEFERYAAMNQSA